MSDDPRVKVVGRAWLRAKFGDTFDAGNASGQAEADELAAGHAKEFLMMFDAARQATDRAEHEAEVRAEADDNDHAAAAEYLGTATDIWKCPTCGIETEALCNRRDCGNIPF